MDDLIAFYEAQLDEDEQDALAASPGPWHVSPDGDEVLAADHIPAAEAFALSGNQQRATARHIARHDPARVVADVEADRKLLTAYRDLTVRVSENNGKAWRLKQGSPDDIGQITTANRHGERLAGRLDGLTYALQVRVERYADRPGYKETWRP